jgi:hypothetical protein
VRLRTARGIAKSKITLPMELTITLTDRQRRLLMELLNRTPLRGNEASGFVSLMQAINAARPSARLTPEPRIDHDEHSID